MGVDVNLTGNGSIGKILPGWSVREDITPFIPGDSSGGVGQVSLSAGRAADSEFVYENNSTFTHPSLGSLTGEVMANTVSGSSDALTTTVDMTLSTPLGAVSAERTALAVGTAIMSDAGSFSMPTTLSFGNKPAELASHANGDISYLYQNPTVADVFYLYRVTQAGAITSLSFTVTGAGNGGNTSGMVVDSSNNYYIAFTAATIPRIYKYSSVGALVTSWGGTGTGNGQFGFLPSNSNLLHYDAYAGNRIYVADYSNNRVQSFDLSGNYVSQIASANVYAVTTYLGSTVVTATYDGIYRVFDKTTGTLIRQSVRFVRTQGEIVGLGFSSDGIHLLALVNLGVYPGQYLVVRIDYATLQEVQTWSFNNDLYTLRFSIGPTFITLSGSSAVNVPKISRMIYSRTTLFGAISYYLALVGVVANYSGPQTNAVFPGWSGNVWDKIKQMCTALLLEFSVVNNTIVVRPIGQNVFTVDQVQEASVSLSIGAPTARTVTMGYTNAAISNPDSGTTNNVYTGTLYNAKTAGTVFSVNAGETVIQTVTTSNYPAIIEKPNYGDLNYSGTYAVIDSSSPAAVVSYALWSQYGGDISVSQNIDSQTSLDIYITGPGVVIPGTVGPYRLATTVAGTGLVTPAFSVSGYGIFTTPQDVTLFTAASQSRNVADGPGDVSNPFITTLSQAYDRGAWTSSLAGGPTVDMALTVPTLSLAGFGLTNGSIISFKQNKYRLSSINYRDGWASMQASRSASIADYETIQNPLGGSGKTTYQNLNKNPSAETAGPLVHVTANLINDPSGRRGVSHYSGSNISGLGYTPGANTYWSFPSAVPTGFAQLHIQTLTIGVDILASTTYVYSGSLYTSTTPLRLYAQGAGVASGGLGAATTVGSGFTRQTVTFTTGTSGAVSLDILNAAVAVSGGDAGMRDMQVEVGTVATSYFDGTYSNPADDFIFYWAGVVDNSVSYRDAYSVSGYWAGVSAAIQSSLWSDDRAESIRIISNYSTTGSAYAELTGALTAAEASGRTFTLLATVRTTTTPTSGMAPSISSVSRIGAGAYLYQVVTAPSTAPGVYQLRLTFSIPVGTTELYLRLYSNVPMGDRDAWFDSIALISGTYTGSYFDGYTSSGLVRWDGLPDNSTSTKITASRSNGMFNDSWPSSQMSDFTIKPLRAISV